MLSQLTNCLKFDIAEVLKRPKMFDGGGEKDGKEKSCLAKCAVCPVESVLGTKMLCSPTACVNNKGAFSL